MKQQTMPSVVGERARVTFVVVVVVAGLSVFGGVFAFFGIALAQTPSPDFGHFTYDAMASLNIKQTSVEARNGVTIEDITYTGSSGDTVPAYLVIPKGTGKFAGIIWGHWLMEGAENSNRKEFLDEAIALAPNGIVSLLIDAPQTRPDFKPMPGIGPGLIAEQVVDLRRGVDLLLARADIDGARVAYVGHSYDSVAGAILDAMDKRFAAFVFMAGPQSTWAYIDPYAKELGPALALFQYCLDDKEVPLADAKAYIVMASGPKVIKLYDADHGLNNLARMDRDKFLVDTLER